MATGPPQLEIHTGHYADTRGTAQAVELRRISAFAKAAHRAGFKVHAGHGLTTANVAAIARIPQIVELNIGHSIVADRKTVVSGKSVSVRVDLGGRRSRKKKNH